MNPSRSEHRTFTGRAMFLADESGPSDGARSHEGIQLRRRRARQAATSKNAARAFRALCRQWLEDPATLSGWQARTLLPKRSNAIMDAPSTSNFHANISISRLLVSNLLRALRGERTGERCFGGVFPLWRASPFAAGFHILHSLARHKHLQPSIAAELTEDGDGRRFLPPEVRGHRLRQAPQRSGGVSDPPPMCGRCPAA